MKQLVPTEDGSLTQFHEETGELYHNRAGAYTEALRNYYEPSDAGERLKQNGLLRLLDACFGLGYNSFVLLEQLMQCGLSGRIEIVAVENDGEILRSLPLVLADPRFTRLRAAFGQRLPEDFSVYELRSAALEVQLQLVACDLRDFARQLNEPLDLVFHDPFSPRKVPELWSCDLFSRYYQALVGRGGQLLTYSTASAVRGGLRSCGFQIFRTAAVGAKSGGTLAGTDNRDRDRSLVQALGDEDVKRLDGRPGVPYRDPGLISTRQSILDARKREQDALSD